MLSKIKEVTKTVVIYTNSMGEEKEIHELDKRHLLNAYDKALRDECYTDAIYLRAEIARRLTVAETKRSFGSIVKE